MTDTINRREADEAARHAEGEEARHLHEAESHFGNASDLRDLTGQRHPGEARAWAAASRAHLAAADAHFAARDAQTCAVACNEGAAERDDETSALADEASHAADCATEAANRAAHWAQGPNFREEDIGWVSDETGAEEAALEAAQRDVEASAAATTCEQGH